MSVGNDFNESICYMEVAHIKHWPIMKESIRDSTVLKKMVNGERNYSYNTAVSLTGDKKKPVRVFWVVVTLTLLIH